MSGSRLETLLQYYKEEPHEPFNLYALAIEYLAVDPDKARQFFELLLANHPQYLPTYYHAAKLFQEDGNTNQAAEIYKKGIALARERNDAKALRELESAYQELMLD